MKAESAARRACSRTSPASGCCRPAVGTGRSRATISATMSSWRSVVRHARRSGRSSTGSPDVPAPAQHGVGDCRLLSRHRSARARQPRCLRSRHPREPRVQIPRRDRINGTAHGAARHRDSHRRRRLANRLLNQFTADATGRGGSRAGGGERARQHCHADGGHQGRVVARRSAAHHRTFVPGRTLRAGPIRRLGCTLSTFSRLPGALVSEAQQLKPRI